MFTEVPVVDVAPFLAHGRAGKRAGAGEIGRACTEIGFFTVVGHGVPADLIAETIEVTKAFFHQPNYDAVVECLPTCTGPDNPAKYPPVSSSEHRLRKYLAGLSTASPPR